nr:arrestin family protein 1 [Quercus suber]
MAASVKVCARHTSYDSLVKLTNRPTTNSVGYPGISATLPRIEGKVEIRPAVGVSAPVNVSLVTVSLQRRESINPTADSMIRSSLSSSRKEITDLVGKEMLLYRAPPGKESEAILCMDLPFVLFIPYGRGGEEVARRVPPASLQLDKRTAETFYEIVVMVQQGPQDQRKYPFAVPISRYDTLSTFGMYNRPESAERVSDHIVTLGISLPRWSYGPLDPVSVYIKLSPNPEYMSKAKRVTIQSITVGIDEEIIFNHEGDEPKRNTKTLAKHTQQVGVRMPEAGYFTNLGLVFPGRDLRDNDGVLPRGKKEFPTYAVSGFTTTGTLYKIEYYLTVKAKMSSARDIILRQPIVVCPFDHAGCKEEMEAIEQAAKDAAHISPDNPMLPAAVIIKANDPAGLRPLGIAIFCKQDHGEVYDSLDAPRFARGAGLLGMIQTWIIEFRTQVEFWWQSLSLLYLVTILGPYLALGVDDGGQVWVICRCVAMLEAQVNGCHTWSALWFHNDGRCLKLRVAMERDGIDRGQDRSHSTEVTSIDLSRRKPVPGALLLLFPSFAAAGSTEEAGRRAAR